MGGLDYFIIALFFGSIVYVGYLFKQVSGNTREFFLAGHSLPGWLAGISFISGNVSALMLSYMLLALGTGLYV